MFKVGDEVNCIITEIDKEKRRILISHKQTLKNPYDNLPVVGSELEGIVSNMNDYALYLSLIHI